MSLNSFYTIDQLRTSVEHHLFAQKASIEVVKRKSQVLLGLLNKYNEDLSLQDNIYQYLSGVSKRSYDSQCGYLKQWVIEEGIDCNFEINYKDIPRNYMTIETLNEKLFIIGARVRRTFATRALLLPMSSFSSLNRES